MTKLYFLIIFMFAAHYSIGQYRRDTTIAKKTLDSLQQQVFYYKDIARKQYYQNLVDKYTLSTDTVYSVKKDTLIILNLGKEANVLRKQIFKTDNSGCKTSLNDFFYDITGRLLYEEQWSLSCNLEDPIKSLMQNRIRYHYDSLGDASGMTIEFWNGGGHRVRRADYFLDKTGQKVWGNRFPLNEYAFWD